MTTACAFTGSLPECTAQASKVHRTVDETLVAFYYDYRAIVRMIGSLRLNCQSTASRLSPLDDVARHDVVLSLPELERLGLNNCDPRQGALSGLSSGLNQALETMNHASSRIDGYFHGELKVKTENRLNHLKADVQRMLAAMVLLAEEQEPPRTPYLLRQQGLSIFHCELTHLATSMGNLRRKLGKEPGLEQLMSTFCKQENRLCQVRAKVSRWRDNPSQKMRAKLELCLVEMVQLEEEASALLRETVVQAAKAGCRIFNRQGPVNVLSSEEGKSQ